jgi:hypothetical protein
MWLPGVSDSPPVPPIVGVKLNLGPTKGRGGRLSLVVGGADWRTSIGNRARFSARVRKYLKATNAGNIFITMLSLPGSSISDTDTE